MQPWHWSCLSPARVVRQTAVLPQEMSRRLQSRAAEAVVAGAKPYDLLRVALLTTDDQSVIPLISWTTGPPKMRQRQSQPKDCRTRRSQNDWKYLWAPSRRTYITSM